MEHYSNFRHALEHLAGIALGVAGVVVILVVVYTSARDAGLFDKGGGAGGDGEGEDR